MIKEPKSCLELGCSLDYLTSLPSCCQKELLLTPLFVAYVSASISNYFNKFICRLWRSPGTVQRMVDVVQSESSCTTNRKLKAFHLLYTDVTTNRIILVLEAFLKSQ